jgi:hypothetical protein
MDADVKHGRTVPATYIKVMSGQPHANEGQ